MVVFHLFLRLIYNTIQTAKKKLKARGLFELYLSGNLQSVQTNGRARRLLSNTNETIDLIKNYLLC